MNSSVQVSTRTYFKLEKVQLVGIPRDDHRCVNNVEAHLFKRLPSAGDRAGAAVDRVVVGVVVDFDFEIAAAEEDVELVSVALHGDDGVDSAEVGLIEGCPAVADGLWAYNEALVWGAWAGMPGVNSIREYCLRTICRVGPCLGCGRLRRPM